MTVAPFVRLTVADPNAQDLLWQYARRIEKIEDAAPLSRLIDSELAKVGYRRIEIELTVVEKGWDRVLVYAGRDGNEVWLNRSDCALLAKRGGLPHGQFAGTFLVPEAVALQKGLL